MSTNRTRRKFGSVSLFAERAATGLGQFTDESRVVFSELIVSFYNDTNIRDSSVEVVRQRARKCAQGFSGRGKPLLVLAYLLLNESYFLFDTAPKNFVMISEVAKQLRKERHDFRNAVRWLCLPKNPRDPAVQPAIRYFNDHGLVHSRRFLLLVNKKMQLFWEPTDVVDFFCMFLISECHNKEPADMPIKLCRHCGRLFTAFDSRGKENNQKAYCSRRCQHQHFWTKDRKADHKYVLRLYEDNHYAPQSMSKRLMRPKTQQRLIEIEGRWSNWEGLMEKMREIREWQAKLAIRRGLV